MKKNRTAFRLSVEGRFRRTIHYAALAGMAGSTLLSTNASAQEAAAEAAPPESEAVELDVLEVTGSRIPKVGLTSVSPVTTVNSAEVKLQGAVRVEDLLNSLPQVFADQGAYLANGATGTATVNLRNLGPSRTLVLIDGKRLIPGDPRIQSAAPDLNNIPAALIESVDIMTGGASAVYGSDAVAGVVNFKMLRDFEGVRLGAQHSFYMHENARGDMVTDAVRRRLAAGGDPTQFFLPKKKVMDGKGNDFSIVLGTNTGDGKGNATLYATYLNIDAVDQGQRSYSACALAGRTNPALADFDKYRCSGSGTNATGQFTDFDKFSFTVIPDGQGGGAFRPFSSATDQFNFNPYNYFQRNDERYGLGAFAHYEVNPHFDVYTDIMFMDDRTDAVIAPSGLFFDPTVTTSCSNPLLGTVDPDGAGPQRSQFDALCADQGLTASDDTTFFLGRRNVEGGGRDDDLRHTSNRVVVGTKGNIAGSWNYDVYAQYGQTLLSEIYRRDFSKTRILRALDVVTDPATGAPVCSSVLDGTDPNCVPWNVWEPGGVNQAALDYLQTPGFLTGQTVERIVSGSVTANLGEYGVVVPAANEGIGIALGAEYRREESNFESDLAFSTGDLSGQGGPTVGTRGAFQVKEFFSEARVPLVQNMPLAQDIGLDLGYRYSDYDAAGSTDTYKFGANWAPSSDVNLRASFNRAVRAPNVIELSSPFIVALDGNTDPCAGTTITPGPTPGQDKVEGGATRAECANDPAIAADPTLFGKITPNPAAQYNGQLGSSPGLEPETADTFTAGIVFTPSFIKDFSVTLDYYDIEVEALIDEIGADTILAECYSGNTAVCPLIHRDSLGSLWISPDGFVTDTIQNTGSLGTKGIDLDVLYQLTLADYGRLSFDFRGVHILAEDHQPIPGGETFGCEGKYGLECGTPIPKWRHKFRTTWQTPYYGANVSAQWRHIASVDADRTTIAGTISNDRSLDAANYLDLAGSLPILGKYNFRVGVNNILDKDPPVIGQAALPSVFGSGNTFPQVYDALGRYVYLGVQIEI